MKLASETDYHNHGKHISHRNASSRKCRHKKGTITHIPSLLPKQPHRPTTYWQKYNAPNNFWDYMRLIRFYDTSVYDQIRKMIPAKANTNVGLLIEPMKF